MLVEMSGYMRYEPSPVEITLAEELAKKCIELGEPIAPSIHWSNPLFERSVGQYTSIRRPDKKELTDIIDSGAYKAGEEMLVVNPRGDGLYAGYYRWLSPKDYHHNEYGLTLNELMQAINDTSVYSEHVELIRHNVFIDIFVKGDKVTELTGARSQDYAAAIKLCYGIDIPEESFSGIDVEERALLSSVAIQKIGEAAQLLSKATQNNPDMGKDELTKMLESVSEQTDISLNILKPMVYSWGKGQVGSAQLSYAIANFDVAENFIHFLKEEGLPHSGVDIVRMFARYMVQLQK